MWHHILLAKWNILCVIPVLEAWGPRENYTSTTERYGITNNAQELVMLCWCWTLYVSSDSMGNHRMSSLLSFHHFLFRPIPLHNSVPPCFISFFCFATLCQLLFQCKYVPWVFIYLFIYFLCSPAYLCSIIPMSESLSTGIRHLFSYQLHVL